MTIINKLKFAVAGSYMISQEQKKILLKELPHYSQKQCEDLLNSISEFEAKGNEFVKAGFAADDGKKLSAELKIAVKNLKKSSIKQIEKEESGDALSILENQMTNL